MTYVIRSLLKKFLIDRNVELDEIMMNTKMISNIVSMDELRYKSATSFKAYRDLKLENEPMPANLAAISR